MEGLPWRSEVLVLMRGGGGGEEKRVDAPAWPVMRGGMELGLGSVGAGGNGGCEV